MYKIAAILCIIIHLVYGSSIVYAENPTDEYLYINLW